MKLYCANIDFEFYVAAENNLEAEKLVRINYMEALRDITHRDFSVDEATSIDSNWYDEYPYGKTDKKCCEIMEEMKAAEKQRKYIKKHYVNLPGVL